MGPDRGNRDRVEDLGGLDLTGKAAVLKTAGRKPIGVRIPGPPLSSNGVGFRHPGGSPAPLPVTMGILLFVLLVILIATFGFWDTLGAIVEAVPLTVVAIILDVSPRGHRAPLRPDPTRPALRLMRAGAAQ
jgi:hypothetical protein